MFISKEFAGIRLYLQDQLKLAKIRNNIDTMILPSNLKFIGRCFGSSLFKYQINNKVNRLAPISCYRRFHLRDETLTIRKTGFVNNYSDLHKAIHSDSALCLRYSNLLGQKAKQDERTPKNDKSADSESLADPNSAFLEDGKQLGLFSRFKKMAKDYWYVLIPVHVVTSCIWLGSFYYISVR